MKLCTICGLSQDQNPVHSAEFKGIGAHTFAAEEIPAEESDDIVVYGGGSIKAIGEDGQIEGFLIQFTGSSDPDLTKEFFTKSTELFRESGDALPVLYDHGLDKTLKRRKIGRAKMEIKDAGVWIEAQLNLADDYEKLLYEELVKPGKAGFSSGAASHMTSRKKSVDGTNEITEWGLTEASITPAPTEPRCKVQSLKSFSEERVDALEQPQETKKEDTEAVKAVSDQEDHQDETEIAKATNGSMKGIFANKLKEKHLSFWELQSTLDSVLRDIATVAITTEITDVTIDIPQKVGEAVSEFASVLAPIVVKQIQDYVDKGGDCEGSRYYLRSLEDLIESVGVDTESGATIDQHSAKTVSVLGEYVRQVKTLDEYLDKYIQRCESRVAFRKERPNSKSGRVLSKDTVGKLGSIKDNVATLLADLSALGEKIGTSSTKIDALIDEATPKTPEEKSSSLAVELEMLELELQAQHTLLGLV